MCSWSRIRDSWYSEFCSSKKDRRSASSASFGGCYGYGRGPCRLSRGLTSAPIRHAALASALSAERKYRRCRETCSYAARAFVRRSLAAPPGFPSPPARPPPSPPPLFPPRCAPSRLSGLSGRTDAPSPLPSPPRADPHPSCAAPRFPHGPRRSRIIARRPMPSERVDPCQRKATVVTRADLLQPLPWVAIPSLCRHFQWTRTRRRTKTHVSRHGTPGRRRD